LLNLISEFLKVIPYLIVNFPVSLIPVISIAVLITIEPALTIPVLITIPVPVIIVKQSLVTIPVLIPLDPILIAVTVKCVVPIPFFRILVHVSLTLAAVQIAVAL
jgi:hypothetical protein